MGGGNLRSMRILPHTCAAFLAACLAALVVALFAALFIGGIDELDSSPSKA